MGKDFLKSICKGLDFQLFNLLSSSAKVFDYEIYYQLESVLTSPMYIESVLISGMYIECVVKILLEVPASKCLPSLFHQSKERIR
jgi:hypothetical protein